MQDPVEEVTADSSVTSEEDVELSVNDVVNGEPEAEGEGDSESSESAPDAASVGEEVAKGGVDTPLEDGAADGIGESDDEEVEGSTESESAEPAEGSGDSEGENPAAQTA